MLKIIVFRSERVKCVLTFTAAINNFCLSLFLLLWKSVSSITTSHIPPRLSWYAQNDLLSHASVPFPLYYFLIFCSFVTNGENFSIFIPATYLSASRFYTSSLLISTYLAGVSTLTERTGSDGVEHEAVVTPKTTQHLPAASFHSLPVTHHQFPRRSSGMERGDVLMTGFRRKRRCRCWELKVENDACFIYYFLMGKYEKNV